MTTTSTTTATITFWKLYGIGLPDDVLKKVYYKNALKITPRLPQTEWPHRG
jgi:hypothetical protein